ncbi:MAG: transposase [Candidatus Shapirobacteria bacterium]|nr:transposase [Candidatus Shapirobacteria bacterium]
MTQFAEHYLIESPRLKNWDYSTPGIYFITICTVHHNNFFGKVIDNKMELSKMGIIAKTELVKTFEIRKSVKLHEYVIMPNHVHILMEIINNNYDYKCRDVLQNVSTEDKVKEYFSNISPKGNSISNIIKQFKSSVTRLINPKTVFFGWQPRFYDQIIKTKEEYFVIKKYIQNNIFNWQKDKFYKN